MKNPNELFGQPNVCVKYRQIDRQIVENGMTRQNKVCIWAQLTGYTGGSGGNK